MIRESPGGSAVGRFSFSLSETTDITPGFCEFVRTRFFYEKSLAKWAELYYNITVLFFGIALHL